MVCPVEVERTDGAFLRSLAIDSQSVDLVQRFSGIVKQIALVCSYRLSIKRLQPLNCAAQPNRTDKVRRSCLEFEGQGSECRALERNAIDHIATAHIWGHSIEQSLLSVEHADTRRTIEFVSRKGVEIAIQRLHIDPSVHHALATIDHHHSPNSVSCIDHTTQVGHSA